MNGLRNEGLGYGTTKTIFHANRYIFAGCPSTSSYSSFSIGFLYPDSATDFLQTRKLARLFNIRPNVDAPLPDRGAASTVKAFVSPSLKPRIGLPRPDCDHSAFSEEFCVDQLRPREEAFNAIVFPNTSGDGSDQRFLSR